MSAIEAIRAAGPEVWAIYRALDDGRKRVLEAEAQRLLEDQRAAKV
jgi:hypothetical protein